MSNDKWVVNRHTQPMASPGASWPAGWATWYVIIRQLILVGLRVPTATQPKTYLHISLCQSTQDFIFTFITILRGREGNGTVHWQIASQTFGQAMIWTPKWGLDLRNSGRQLHCGKKKDAFTEKIFIAKGMSFWSCWLWFQYSHYTLVPQASLEAQW